MLLGWRQRRRRRAALDALARDRRARLRAQGIDQRLVEAVWGPPEGVVCEILDTAALTDVAWLDEVVVDEDGAVPLLSLSHGEEGIVAANGWLLHLHGDQPRQCDLLAVWQRLFEAPLSAWLQAERQGRVDELPGGLRVGARLDRELLGLEMERLRGEPLRAWFDALTARWVPHDG